MTNAVSVPVYKNPRQPIAERVDDLMSRMSPAQKLAQLNCSPLTFVPDERRTAAMGQGMARIGLSNC